MAKQTTRNGGKARSISSTPLPEQAAVFDVSIILNLHNEARYLKRTILSLEEAVRYARQFDITFEIVVVLDNADKATAALAEGWDYAAFDGFRIIHVRNGSLGLSRNDGIAVARGEYIATADADDLVGFDYFQKLYMTICSLNARTIVFPEYYFGFGTECYIWKFYDQSLLGNAVFFESHPYVSRVIFHRDVYSRVKFADVSLRSGYAFEDWHFNCECLAAGLSIEIARGAMLFYRQRPGSLLRRADSETSRLIPRSRFFEPLTYLKLTWAEFAGGGRRLPSAPQFTLETFLDDPGVSEVAAAANRIDPAISLGILRYKSASTNLRAAGQSAQAYFEACKHVAGNEFTDVLLVPFMAKGGAEKYILSVIDALGEMQPDTRLLVIATQRHEKHEWIEKLPQGSVFVDLHALGANQLTAADVEIVAFRLIQNTPGIRRIHMKNCEFVDSFARRYLRYLSHLDTTFYHFCDPRVSFGGLPFVNGQCFDLVSEVGPFLTRIVSDHRKELDFIGEMVGEEIPSKSHALYTRCDLPPAPDAHDPEPRNRLLWASRIDGQKRPHLVAEIARRLEGELPGISVDAFGGTTYGVLGPEVFEGVGNLVYRGEFGTFGETSPERYDAFLYTAAFDGLPNVVLEAMAAGLPVIAPDVGGIGEAVSPETGYLIEDDVDESVMVDCYVAAIRELYRNWDEMRRRSLNGRKLVETRHSRNAMLRRVGDIFGIAMKTPIST